MVRRRRETLAAAYFNNRRYLDEDFVRNWGQIIPTILMPNIKGLKQLFWASPDSLFFKKGFVGLNILRAGRMREFEFIILNIYPEGIKIGSRNPKYMFRQDLKW
jgi:hypothetical protein